MPDPRFHTTQWTLVFTAAADDAASRPALNTLCEMYWFPVYAFIRRQGHDATEAEDLTQAFYAKLIEKAYLAQVDRSRGKFRTFLLASVKHFLSNQRDRTLAQKRGGGATHVPIDLTAAEERYASEKAGGLSPEEIFEKRCALSLLDTALGRLREEYVERDDLRGFEALAPLLTGDSPDLYEKVADDLGMSRGALRVALHRMRGRFRLILREHVASLVAAPDQIEEEIRHLMNAVTI
ncbi:MAG TPA: sigma-70 family RNA polymerase sigma factor [Thermoanaerobaculia bacterium]|nr:sigma-70 family RNA polymerase sigma factor [Thermoanaerobaculia bacterium]